MVLSMITLTVFAVFVAYTIGQLCDRVREIQKHLGLPVGITAGQIRRAKAIRRPE